MSDASTLKRIKRAVLAGRFEFSAKAAAELQEDNLSEIDVAESIMNAVAIYKTIRSTSAARKKRGEKLHIIMSPNLDDLSIYTKGKLVRIDGLDQVYFLVSSKRSTEL